MPARNGEVLIGYVGIDSGQMLLTDPCYIDSEWVREEMQEKCIVTYPNGKKETIKRCSKRWFELIDDINSGKIKLEEKIEPKNNFSYNACAEKTLKKPHYGQLNFKLGHAGVGVVFSSGIGDGLYPVYAKIEEVDGLGPRIMEIRIDMWDHPLLKPEVKKNGKK